MHLAENKGALLDADTLAIDAMEVDLQGRQPRVTYFRKTGIATQ